MASSRKNEDIERAISSEEAASILYTLASTHNINLASIFARASKVLQKPSRPSTFISKKFSEEDLQCLTIYNRLAKKLLNRKPIADIPFAKNIISDLTEKILDSANSVEESESKQIILSKIFNSDEAINETNPRELEVFDAVRQKFLSHKPQDLNSPPDPSEIENIFSANILRTIRDNTDLDNSEKRTIADALHELFSSQLLETTKIGNSIQECENEIISQQAEISELTSFTDLEEVSIEVNENQIESMKQKISALKVLLDSNKKKYATILAKLIRDQQSVSADEFIKRIIVNLDLLCAILEMRPNIQPQASIPDPIIQDTKSAESDNIKRRQSKAFFVTENPILYQRTHATSNPDVDASSNTSNQQESTNTAESTVDEITNNHINSSSASPDTESPTSTRSLAPPSPQASTNPAATISASSSDDFSTSSDASDAESGSEDDNLESRSNETCSFSFFMQEAHRSSAGFLDTMQPLSRPSINTIRREFEKGDSLQDEMDELDLETPDQASANSAATPAASIETHALAATSAASSESKEEATQPINSKALQDAMFLYAQKFLRDECFCMNAAQLFMQKYKVKVATVAIATSFVSLMLIHGNDMEKKISTNLISLLTSQKAKALTKISLFAEGVFSNYKNKLKPTEITMDEKARSFLLNITGNIIEMQSAASKMEYLFLQFAQAEYRESSKLKITDTVISDSEQFAKEEYQSILNSISPATLNARKLHAFFIAEEFNTLANAIYNKNDKPPLRLALDMYFYVLPEIDWTRSDDKLQKALDELSKNCGLDIRLEVQTEGTKEKEKGAIKITYSPLEIERQRTISAFLNYLNHLRINSQNTLLIDRAHTIFKPLLKQLLSLDLKQADNNHLVEQIKNISLQAEKFCANSPASRGAKNSSLFFTPKTSQANSPSDNPPRKKSGP